jgi:hypothetical protein
MGNNTNEFNYLELQKICKKKYGIVVTKEKITTNKEWTN